MTNGCHKPVARKKVGKSGKTPKVAAAGTARKVLTKGLVRKG